MRRMLLIVLALLPIALSAQVSNDKIIKSIALDPEALLHTSTAQAAVEPDCLNRALATKWLVYHNDQWFSFRVLEPHLYYLNISGQQCRDKKGIQVILVEGNPCETTEYRITQCIPQIKDEETFVPLGELKANKTYLIEIDGFLGDHCDFKLQLSRRPVGLPLSASTQVRLTDNPDPTILKDSIIAIPWSVPGEWIKKIDQFRVYRMDSRDAYVLERIVPLARNTYGQPSAEYSMYDTLSTTGNYRYRVLGYAGYLEPLVVAEMSFHYQRQATEKAIGSQSVSIEPDFEQNAPFEIRVYDRKTHQVIKKLNGVYDPEHPETINVDLREAILGGQRSFLVLLINESTKQAREFYFRVDIRGTLVVE